MAGLSDTNACTEDEDRIFITSNGSLLGPLCPKTQEKHILDWFKEEIDKESIYDQYISLPISGSSSIEECIEKFQKNETLTGEDQPFCESCQKKCDMTKSLRISKIPRTLLLHLKRFSSKSRDSSLIKFPVDSSLSLGSSEFKLSSVINHQGKSTSSGHYLASVRHNGNWFSISDEKVSCLEKVESADAYVLFYTSQ
ncbi:unnamed protein product [Oikopleura dioica]|uniref:ubiquitinyl hydrolase 1 n=1 Tax=Oikopleura dioica TaxID=34765 RepID=E4X1P9_OIKDI|nr:unnamed protein product [Oikopleura dioica]